MGKVKQWLIEQEEQGMERDEIDAMWHQKQLEEEQQSELLRVARERNLFEQRALLDAIAYGNYISQERKR
jgi:hypothetical protein